jgi:hypothetical protein
MGIILQIERAIGLKGKRRRKRANAKKDKAKRRGKRTQANRRQRKKNGEFKKR